MESNNQITYETIIEYLKEKKISFSLGSSKKEIVNPILKNNNFVYYGLPDFSNELDYFLGSLIFCLNKEDFLDNENFDDKMKDLKLFLRDNNISENYLEIIKFFKINVLIVTKDELFCLPCNNIVDIYLPHILLFYQDNKFYPSTIDNKELLFYNESEEFVSNYYENSPKIFKNLYKNYQILDDIEESINNFLKVESKKNDCFINESEVEKIQNLNKLKKVELIEHILSKSDYKKSELNKMKKSDLIKLLD